MQTMSGRELWMLLRRDMYRRLVLGPAMCIALLRPHVRARRAIKTFVSGLLGRTLVKRHALQRRDHLLALHRQRRRQELPGATGGRRGRRWEGRRQLEAMSFFFLMRSWKS